MQAKEDSTVSVLGTRVRIDDEEWTLDEKTDKMKPFLKKKRRTNKKRLKNRKDKANVLIWNIAGVKKKTEEKRGT